MIDSEVYNFNDRVFIRSPFYSVDDYEPLRLPEILRRQAFQNALFLASSSFYALLEKKDFNADLLSEKERFTIFKYYNRMSFRPVPFGAFSTIGLTRWGEKETIRLVTENDTVIHLLPSLEAKLTETTAFSGNGDTLLITNPTLYKAGASLRYTKSLSNDSGKLDFSLEAIAAADLNNELLRETAGKAVSRSVLVNWVTQKTGCTVTEADDYVVFLMEEQVLLPDYTPGLILYGDLSKPESRNAGILLPELKEEQIKTMTVPPFYACAERGTSRGAMETSCQGKLSSLLSALRRLTINGTDGPLEEFKKAFKSRFDWQKVPLLTALDPDEGISYGNLHQGAGHEHLLEGLHFPDLNSDDHKLHWTRIHKLFLRIWLQNSARSKQETVMLQDVDISALDISGADLKLPPSIAVLFSLTKDKLLLESAGGPSATLLTGRFSAFSNDIAEFCKEIAADERRSNPDIVFAEIHQRSHGHVDNINRRQQLYDHLIPLNVFPAAGERGHLFPADLLVSIQADEVVLESVSLGKRIIPRLPTAYNFQHNELAIFRFLCDLQYQGLATDLTFSLEKLFPGLDYYPRVEYKDSVISLAKWNITKAQQEQLTARPLSLGRLHLFRQEYAIPRFVSLGRSDQQLVFDLASDTEAFYFLQCLSESDTAVVREYISPGGEVTSDKKKRHAAQFIAVLNSEKPVYRALSRRTLSVALPQRDFLPGGEWLYIKLYCTSRSANMVLLNVVKPVLEKLEDLIVSWFFIRYQDPKPHLRIRLKSAPEKSGMLLSAFRQELLDSGTGGLVNDIKLETYCRELERYSPELIEQVEDFFQAGSSLFLNKLQHSDGAVTFGRAPFAEVYHVMTSFLDHEADYVAFLARISGNFLREFGANEQLKFTLDKKYRAVCQDLKHELESFSVSNHGSGLWALLLARLAQIKSLTVNWPPPLRENLLADLIHMHINRCYSARQRQNEAVIYYCLHKFELSRLAQQKRNSGMPLPVSND